MSNHLWLKLIAGAALLALASCGDDDDGRRRGDNDGGGGGGGATPIQNQFGPVFQSAFNLDATDEPIDPQPGDLPAVSFTTDPIDF